MSDTSQNLIVNDEQEPVIVRIELSEGAGLAAEDIVRQLKRIASSLEVIARNVATS